MDTLEKATNKITSKLIFHTAEALKYENEWKQCLKHPDNEESIRLAYACMTRHQDEQKIYQHILNILNDDR